MNQEGKIICFYLLFDQFNEIFQIVAGSVIFLLYYGLREKELASMAYFYHTFLWLWRSHLTCWNFSFCIIITFHYDSPNRFLETIILTIDFAYFLPFLSTCHIPVVPKAFSKHGTKPLSFSFLPTPRSWHLDKKCSTFREYKAIIT